MLRVTRDVGTNVVAVGTAGLFSLEMTARDIDGLSEAAELLAPDTQISVTFLPGETQCARAQAALAVRRLGLQPMPHISARRLPSREALEDYLRCLQAETSVDRAFVVAGDAPAPQGPFADALDVIRSGLLAQYGIPTVGVAGYPEGHPQIDDATLWSALHAKRRALREAGHRIEIITQFAFDADPVLAWVERVRAVGITDPIRIGVPGPASVKTLLRFARLCGVSASAKAMATYGLSITKLLNTAGPDRLVESLLERLEPAIHGHVRLHLYAFGGLRRAAEWMRDFQTTGVSSSPGLPRAVRS